MWAGGRITWIILNETRLLKTDMRKNKPEYDREYNRERAVRCFPPPKDLKVIKAIQEQKPAMSRSAVACYLISLGIEAFKKANKNAY